MAFPALAALADLRDLSIGQQRGVVTALASARPSLLVEIAGREDVPAELRMDLVRGAPEYLLDRVLRGSPWSDVLFAAAVEQHGATSELVVLAAANDRIAAAIELAGQLDPDDAISLKDPWEREFGAPMPPNLRSALVRAVLTEREARPDLSGMAEWEERRVVREHLIDSAAEKRS